jgi:predicted TIM-barrel fold metal-dependent hydrolase
LWISIALRQTDHFGFEKKLSPNPKVKSDPKLSSLSLTPILSLYKQKPDYDILHYWNLMIIDSHLHLPGLKAGKTLADSRKELLQEIRKSNVDYAILIPDNTPVSEIGSLDEVLGLVEHDRNLYVMGTIDIQKRNYMYQTRKLAGLFQTRRIVAAKIFPGHDPIYPTDKRLTPLYELCVKHDLPVVIHTGGKKQSKYNDPKFIVKIAEKHPKLKIVIAHYFFPRVEYCHDITRPYRNIYFDTSGLADDEVIAATGLRKIRRILTLTAKERPNNVVFGTDYAMCSIRKHIALIKSLSITSESKERIFSTNSIRLFKLRLE